MSAPRRPPAMPLRCPRCHGPLPGAYCARCGCPRPERPVPLAVVQSDESTWAAVATVAMAALLLVLFVAACFFA